ncbi:MAG: SIMPL domain-containing protein [Myxococcaceae bacterium]
MRARLLVPASLLVVAASGLAWGQPAQSVPPPPPEEPVVQPEAPRAIKVTGEGTVEVPPDEALLTLAVETTAGTAEAAGRLNASHTAALIHALKEQGIAAEDIETGRYELLPVHSEPPEPRGAGGDQDQPKSYRAVNALQVKVKDLKRIGEVIDAAQKAGANRVEQVAFQVENPVQGQQQALQEAVQRARTQAVALAQSLGVQLGPVLEASTSTGPPPPVPLKRELAAESGAPTTPIEPPAQTITASVTLTYEIAG